MMTILSEVENLGLDELIIKVRGNVLCMSHFFLSLFHSLSFFSFSLSLSDYRFGLLQNASEKLLRYVKSSKDAHFQDVTVNEKFTSLVEDIRSRKPSFKTTYGYLSKGKEASKVS